MVTLKIKLKSLKNDIKKLNKEVFGCIHLKKTQVIKEIEELHNRDDDSTFK